MSAAAAICARKRLLAVHMCLTRDDLKWEKSMLARGGLIVPAVTTVVEAEILLSFVK